MTADNAGDDAVRVVLVHRRVGNSVYERDGCERALIHAASALRARMPCHVTALAVGRAADQEPWLRAVARRGCDRLLCVSVDRDQAGERPSDDAQAEPLDAHELAHELTHDLAHDLDGRDHHLDDRDIAELACAVLSGLEIDVILCATCPPSGQPGVQASALAHGMDLAHLSDVVAIEAGSAARELVVAQRADSRIHRWRCALPVVLGVWAHPADADADASVDADSGLDIEYLGAHQLAAARAVPSRRLVGQVRKAPAPPATIVSSPDELLAHIIEGRAPR